MVTCKKITAACLPMIGHLHDSIIVAWWISSFKSSCQEPAGNWCQPPKRLKLQAFTHCRHSRFFEFEDEPVSLYFLSTYLSF